MVFNSIDFLLFFPLFILIYYLIPTKCKRPCLLLASYYFYMSWNIKYIFFLIPLTLITFFLGISINYFEKKVISRSKTLIKKILLGTGCVSTMGLLFILKYSNFFLLSINRILSSFGLTFSVPEIDILLPVGISFYTFEALGYLIDVYRNKVDAEKNLINYSLFLSFFPTIMSGPIERADNLLRQLRIPAKLDVNNLKYGLLSFVWGLYLKLVLADNLSIIVNSIFSNWQERPGCESVLAIILFGIQIYCDFNGYSQMALGTAKMLGIDIINNFNAPYLAANIKDFWRRWHISLTSWFTNYLYISLGGNRKGKIRQYINTITVFGISGLWHGAGLNFVIWGILNGAYLVIYDIFHSLTPPKALSSNTLGTKIGKRFLTFAAVDFAWLFFTMPSTSEAIRVISHIISNFHSYWFFSGSVLNCFSEIQSLFIFIVSLLILFIIDWITYCKKDFREIIFSQAGWCRWLIYLFFLFTIIIWGAYGGDHEQKSFIYFDF